MVNFSEHIGKITDVSDKFEEELYAWATRSTKTPSQAIDKLRRVMSDEFPDGYAATRDDVVKVALIRKELEDVIQRIRKEALARPWPTNSETTSGS